jgi:hypothetical protein
MPKRHDQLVTFDEYGIYEIKDQSLIKIVSREGLIGSALLETFGGTDVFCEDTDGYCGNNAYCENGACGNTACFEEGVNAICGFKLNSIC